ncbi:mpv17-like protein 2 isoform X1 [Leptopilina heterotoma]|uniref:mpv17-like protein 2 isoform X1 n=2 Tax=Leptopilina heterotoma TaxID=63436 RepID=UPI001CA80559|nr:mpv17-like protein 2 isoform X1 [Leptopilina heterotoma]
MEMSTIRNMRLMITKFGPIKEKLFSSKNLLYTNVAISISLSATGDFLEQHYEILKGEWKKFCAKRTAHMALSGMSVGIICHYWYRFLDSRLPGKTIGTVIRKVVIDQFICSPLCIGMFFLTLAILERNDWEEFKREVKNKAHKLYIAEWVVWPPAQIINFYFLPTRYRVLYDNTISLGYDVYTSQVKHDNILNQNN